MLLLATDTSGKQGSIALARCGPGTSCEILEVVALEGGTFSAQLVPQIAALLARHGFSKQDIGAFAVASGPGSFTGLRVGLAAIKALAEVLSKPGAAVSLLEAVAIAGGKRGRVFAAMDAGRTEVYLGEYEVADGAATMVREELATQAECFAAGRAGIIVTPDRNLLDAARAAGVTAEQIERPRSDAIARLGWNKILAGQTVSPDALEANYIRRSVTETKPAV